MFTNISEFNYLGFDLKGKTSGQIRTTCVHCSQFRKKKTDPCVSINLDDGTYYCHNCEKSGTIHKYKYNKMETINYIKPIWHNRTGINTKVVKWFENERKISQATLIKMKISDTEEFFPQIEKNQSCIEFNYFKNNELINIKYRTGNKLFKLHKGSELIFYNYDMLIDNKEIIIVEGEIDCLSYIESGYDNCISVPAGANINKNNLQYLDSCIDLFDGIEKIYIATDNDIPGINLKNELSRRFGFEKCYNVDFKDCKDANEYLIKYGKFELANTIKFAREFQIEGIYRVEDIEENLDVLWQKGMQPGKKVLFNDLDSLITWEKTKLAVITGIPGHGKTEFIDEIIERLNIIHKWKFGIFSPESFPLEVHAGNIISKLTGKKFNRNFLDIEEYYEAKNYMNDNYYFIKPKDENFSLNNILDRAKILIKKYGIDGLIIDPWNRLEHQIGSSLSETNYISQQLDKLTNFAQTYNVLIFLMAHPRKMAKKKGEDFYEVPNLYDINGSANFYNKCDYGLTVYRNYQKGENESTTEIYVQKVKIKNLGKIGFTNFAYNFDNGRYTPDNEFPDNVNHIKEGIEEKCFTT